MPEEYKKIIEQLIKLEYEIYQKGHYENITLKPKLQHGNKKYFTSYEEYYNMQFEHYKIRFKKLTLGLL